MSVRKLAILVTHPIQYHAPWFRALASRSELDLDVFFCHNPAPCEHADAGFGVEFEWDIPLLGGYRSQFLRNVAARPEVNSFGGLDTPEIGAIIGRSGYDAVLVNGWNFKSAWQAFAACWRTGTPVMVRGDSHLHTHRAALKRFAKWPVYRAILPRFDACLAVGKWSREYFLHYGVPPSKIFIVPHDVDEARFSAEAGRLGPRRRELRDQWGLGPDHTVALFAAKFVEKKRPMDFVRAVEGAANGGASVMGLMVGDGPLRAACEAYCTERGVPVSFAGFLNQSRMAEAYVAADVLVLPSDGGETWGLVVNETMACGRPCLVSDRVGCGPDLVIAGETGDVFPLGDVRRLAELLSAYSTDRGALSQMGACSRQHLRNFSTAAAVEGILAALESVTQFRSVSKTS